MKRLIKKSWIKRPREVMVRYLLRQTNYTQEELDQLDDATIEQWYKEEREVDKEDRIF